MPVPSECQPIADAIANLTAQEQAQLSAMPGLAGGHQRNANRFDLTLVEVVVTTVCLWDVVDWSNLVVGRVRCAAGSGHASR